SEGHETAGRGTDRGDRGVPPGRRRLPQRGLRAALAAGSGSRAPMRIVVRDMPHAFEPDNEQWDAWRPQEVARRLAHVDVPWYVAAGWALDLFLGEGPRGAEDLEIAVPRDRLGEVLAVFDECDLFAAGVP